MNIGHPFGIIDVSARWNGKVISTAIGRTARV